MECYDFVWRCMETMVLYEIVVWNAMILYGDVWKLSYDFVWILWVFGLLYGYKFIQFLGFS